MKYKTADLEGPLLNAAVALVEGWAPHLEPLEHWLARTGSYCTEWSAGGPIFFDREGISVRCNADRTGNCWYAYHDLWDETAAGASALTAAARTYVRRNFGNEVDL